VSANRTFLLMGSGEFEPWSEEVERVALEGRSNSVAILPTASAPEGDAVFDRWANMGLEHYAAMGVDARVVPLKTREDADGDETAAAIADAGMIFFSGGNPRYVSDTIDGTRFWDELNAALDRGTVFAGCSAGAMVAGHRSESRPKGVHWDRMRFIPGMRAFVMSRSKGGWFAGIDERTAILGDGVEWRVFGLGTVSLRLDGERRTVHPGESFSTPA
jgi:cyanophycinase